MIKGVNRQIIEVSDTGNTYFERALLIVRAKYSDMDDRMLHDEADRLLKKAGGYTGLRLSRRRRTVHSLLTALGGGMVGAMAGALAAMLLR